MKNIMILKKLNNDVINIRISSKGYGKCYYEVRKDIINYGLGLPPDEKFIISKVLTIIDGYYFK